MMLTNHENIVKYESHFEDKEYIFLVLELAEEGKVYLYFQEEFLTFLGHLYYRLKKNGLYHEKEGSKFMFDIFKGVNYLHQLKPCVIHRDIKPENILFKDGKLKLADFGWSNVKNKVRRTFCGTRDYLAPEMIMKSGHDEKLDVWTLGILTFEVLTGKAPFSPDIKAKTVGQIKQELEYNILNKAVKYPAFMSEAAVDFISKLLSKNPNKRISCEQALQHEWFKINDLHFNPNLEKAMNLINTKDESVLVQEDTNLEKVTDNTGLRVRRNSMPSVLLPNKSDSVSQTAKDDPKLKLKKVEGKTHKTA